MPTDGAFAEVLNRALGVESVLDGEDPGARKDFPLMPYGQACDMGHAPMALR